MLVIYPSSHDKKVSRSCIKCVSLVEFGVVPRSARDPCGGKAERTPVSPVSPPMLLSLILVRLLLLLRRVFICLLCGAVSLVYRLAHCGLGCTLKTPGSSGFVLYLSLSPKQIKQDGVSPGIYTHSFQSFAADVCANCIRPTVFELHALVAQQMVHCVSLGVYVKRGKYVG